MEEISRYHRLYKFENGATLIYYKHNVNNTTQFTVGFIGGSRRDGKIKGTAHFLEHMLCKETPKFTATQFNKFVRNNDIKSNAFTSENYLVLYADTPNSNLIETCKVYRKLLTNKNFNQGSIDLERMAINQEILMSKEEEGDFENIKRLIQRNFRENAILGTSKSISKINEKVLQDYIDKNFVSENLVISVVSNLEFDQVKDIVEKNFVHYFPSNPELKNEPVKALYYSPANIIVANYIKDCQTIDIEVSYGVKQTEREANLYSLVEDYIFNGFSGKLLKRLRSDKGLVYSASFYPLCLQNNLSFKSISASTSKKHINEVIDTLGEIIADIVKNGISERDYKDFKKMVASVEERRSGIKTISPLVLLDRYVDNSEIFFNNQIHVVKNLTREEINNYLKKVYKKANVIVSIEGNFDPKALYTVHEIERRLHAKQSKLLYHRPSEMMVVPHDYSFLNKHISDYYLLKLDESGSLGFIDGNYFSNIVIEKLQKALLNSKANSQVKEQTEKTENYDIELDKGEMKITEIDNDSMKKMHKQNLYNQNLNKNNENENY